MMSRRIARRYLVPLAAVAIGGVAGYLFAELLQLASIEMKPLATPLQVIAAWILRKRPENSS